MKRYVSDTEAKLRHQRKIEAYWGISIIVSIFLLTAYFALRDEKTEPKQDIVPTSVSTDKVSDSIQSVKQEITYSEYYEIGYAKGYAAGEEDTNDGDYMAGYDDTNPYKGENSADYTLGYNHGYEDAYEEMAEHSDDDEPL